MSLQDGFLALPRSKREEAYKVARAKLGPSHPLCIEELMAAYKSIRGDA